VTVFCGVKCACGWQPGCQHQVIVCEIAIEGRPAVSYLFSALSCHTLASCQQTMLQHNIHQATHLQSLQSFTILVSDGWHHIGDVQQSAASAQLSAVAYWQATNRLTQHSTNH
jgi:hypothetical protein